MSRRLAAAALAGVLITASCGGASGAEDELAGLGSQPVDAVLTGAVVSIDPSTDSVRFAIDEVLWARGPYRDESDTLVIPSMVATGDVVGLLTPIEVVTGASYVILGQQAVTPAGDISYSSHGVLDPTSIDMLQPFVPAPPELLLPGETGPAAELAALVGFLEDRARFDSARRSPTALTRRLARALQLDDIRSGGAGQVVTGLEETISLEDYLLLAPALRTLPTTGDLPPVVEEALDVKAMTAHVRLPDGFAERYWAIGFTTPAGIVGPLPLTEGQRVVEIDGYRQRGGAVKLVAWTEPATRRTIGPTRVRLGDKALRSEVAELARSLNARRVLVIDLARGSATTMHPDEAQEALAAVQGPTGVLPSQTG